MAVDVHGADRQPGVARRRLDVLALVGGVAVLLIASWLASADAVSSPEADVFRFFNDAPDWIEAPGWPVMQAGSAAAIVIGAAAVYLVWRRRRLAVGLLLAGGLAWIGAKLIKETVRRERPGALLDDVIQRPEWHGLGFVSGHAAVAFALATILSAHMSGWWRSLLWGVAVATALLRVYTGAHLPLDVVGGAALGVLLGAAVNLAMGVSVWRPAKRDETEMTA